VLQVHARVGEVAEALGVPASTIRSWERRFGVGPSARTAGGHRRYTDGDVAQLCALRDLISRGHGLGRTGSAAVATSDAELVLATTRSLLRSRDVAAVTAALAAFVEVVGGAVVPAADAPRHALPIDLAFGEGPPLVATADEASVARLRLEQHLPALVDDARRIVSLLRR
jgi:DNA-binding transcriptional MerR regulator